MTTFIQLHLLTAYAPSNLNRDDTGRPKTAIMGGYERLRVSSQSLKRAWRTSEVFESALSEHTGKRTRLLGPITYRALIAAGMKDKLAKEVTQKIVDQFGKRKSESKEKNETENLETEQIVHISHHEQALINQLIATLAEENREPTSEELKLLRNESMSVDIALFGRMLASSPEFNIEAACQVAHALGVSAVTVEDDFFTAVDDLQSNEESGSAHMGETAFASALFYGYICINRDQLLESLNGDEALVQKTLRALTETALTVSPNGKQNSFASRAYASYVLAERGTRQPRALSVAFFKPVFPQDQLGQAIEVLQQQRDKFDAVYGKCAETACELNVDQGEGSLSAILDFVSQ